MSDGLDLWAGLRPERPPAELRARVLSAAREAASQAAPSLLEALYRDRLLRLCAAGLAALVLANALVARAGDAAPSRIADPGLLVIDETAAPADAGLTAAEQARQLAPLLDDAFVRSRG